MPDDLDAIIERYRRKPENMAELANDPYGPKSEDEGFLLERNSAGYEKEQLLYHHHLFCHHGMGTGKDVIIQPHENPQQRFLDTIGQASGHRGTMSSKASNYGSSVQTPGKNVHSHGTHVSSYTGAIPNNGQGVHSVPFTNKRALPQKKSGIQIIDGNPYYMDDDFMSMGKAEPQNDYLKVLEKKPQLPPQDDYKKEPTFYVADMSESMRHRGVQDQLENLGDDNPEHEASQNSTLLKAIEHVQPLVKIPSFEAVQPLYVPTISEEDRDEEAKFLRQVLSLAVTLNSPEE